MKTIMKCFAVLAAVGLLSQSALAQENPNAAAATQIARIVVNLNHFPSDADKATLNEIAGNAELAQAVRDMASAVAGINHAASDDAKAAMAAIQEGQAPDRAKVLAGTIAAINHSASDDAKAQLTEAYSL